MTVIAYDGKTVAADRMVATEGVKRSITKLIRASDRAILAVTGRAAGLMEYVTWYEAGCPPSNAPQFDQHTELCVFLKGRRVMVYDGRAFPIFFEDRFFANGSGEDFAMCAMHCGKTAREAVEIACIYRTSCGMGIDTMEVEEHAPQDANTGGDANAGGPTAAEGGTGPAARQTGQGVSDQVSGGAMGGGGREVSGMRWEPQVTLPFPEPPRE